MATSHRANSDTHQPSITHDYKINNTEIEFRADDGNLASPSVAIGEGPSYAKFCTSFLFRVSYDILYILSNTPHFDEAMRSSMKMQISLLKSRMLNEFN